MSDVTSLEAYQKLRNMLRWAFVGTWVLYWYFSLGAERTAQLASISNCVKSSGVSGAVCATTNYFGVLDTFTNSFFVGKMILVVVVSPIAFLPAAFVARRVVRAGRFVGRIQDNRQERVQIQLQHDERQKRIALSDAQTTQARGRNARAEVIMKMGSINDLVDVLEVETDQQRMMTIRLGVAQALRELAAKYDLDALGTLVHGDEATRITVQSVVQRLERTSLANLVELELFKAAISRTSLA